MVEWLKSGGIALLRPSVKKMARSNGKGRWKLVAVMQSNCQQNKGVYQQNRLQGMTPTGLRSFATNFVRYAG